MRVRPGGSDGGGDQALPAGEYLLAMVWFRRQTGRSGNVYLRCRFVVAAGPLQGRGFFCAWSLDASKPGCRKRWELWMEQVGCDVEVDLDDDADIAKHFKGRAFKAVVKLTQRGMYQNNDIDRLVYPRLYSDADRHDVEAWAESWGQRGWESRDPSDPGPQDTDAPSDRSEPQWSPGSGFADDDEPPF